MRDTGPVDIVWLEAVGGEDAWTPPSYVFNRTLATELRKGPLPDVTDVDAARSLLDVVYEDLEAFGTIGGEKLDGTEFELAQKALIQALCRLDFHLSLPWRNFSTFHDHWKSGRLRQQLPEAP